MSTDVHQHIWPPAFIELLRTRTAPPYLDGWTLHLAGEPPYEVDPADHDVTARTALAHADGLDLALVSLSSPLGIEHLPPAEAAPLLAAFHDGALALPAPFGVWASPCLSAPDTAPEAVERELRRGCVGLQLPATALLDAAGWDFCAPLLDVLTRHDKPLFVHPGTAPPTPGTPPWWPALVPYVHQMHASWFAFRAFGRARHPVCASVSPLSRASPRCTANGSRPVAAGAERSTSTPSTRPRRTGRAPWTRSSGPSVSTWSSPAATAPTPHPPSPTSARPPPPTPCAPPIPPAC